MKKRALILVDIQNDYFADGRWALTGMEAASKNAGRLLAAARSSGELVVHVRHEALTKDAPFFAPGSNGSQIHTSVLSAGGEQVILKHFPNSFRGTDLEDLLSKNGIKQVVIAGAMSHMCVEAVTRAAGDLGYGCTVIHDACATRDLEFEGVSIPAAQVHAAAMAALRFGYASVVSTNEFLTLKD